MALFGIFNHKTKESQNSKSEFEKDGLAESEKQSSATSESDLPDLNEAAEKADQEVTPDENERARDQLKEFRKVTAKESFTSNSRWAW